MDPRPLSRQLLGEFLGTLLLLVAVVGASAMSATLSPGDAGLRLLESSATVALALTAIIYTFGPASRAHFNPAVSVADWFLGRRTGTGLTTTDLAGYVAVQIGGAFAGTVLGNLMFGHPAVTVAQTARTGNELLLSETVATAGLLLLISALVRTGRSAAGPGALGAYVGAACWFSSSTGFANPAVTLGRMLTGTPAGIDPGSVPAFVLAQILGLVVACALVPVLYPEPVGVRVPSPAVGDGTRTPVGADQAATGASFAAAGPADRWRRYAGRVRNSGQLRSVSSTVSRVRAWPNRRAASSSSAPVALSTSSSSRSIRVIRPEVTGTP
jgi:arsenate reductase